MLDDIFDLVSDLIGETNINQLTGRRLPGAAQQRKAAKHNKPVSDRPLPRTSPEQTKLTVSRDRRGGEDPWDWKEAKPPWEF
ncbi:MAG: hypothetical protein MSB10_01915 [Clostridiales bacterium]|uniref:hypothetical protein n=1 Tax=Flavonifractor porci TaxID=3133422 RepID=UPI0030B69919|nr:hypothetical protein [Clostridiales bacterium]